MPNEPTVKERVGDRIKKFSLQVKFIFIPYAHMHACSKSRDAMPLSRHNSSRSLSTTRWMKTNTTCACMHVTPAGQLYYFAVVPAGARPVRLLKSFFFCE